MLLINYLTSPIWNDKNSQEIDGIQGNRYFPTTRRTIGYLVINGEVVGYHLYGDTLTELMSTQLL